VVDGTGGPSRITDVAVTGGRISEVGSVGSGRREIDADGLLVTPGWVDIHTHYDGQVTWDPDVSPSGWHGVTTVVVGNCGVGFAPARPMERDWLVQLMEGVEDIPGTALVEGMSWNWESFPEYLDEVDRMPRVLDVAAMIAHGALRAYVLGAERNNAPPTGDEIDLMAKLAREAIEAGAVGLSTSRTKGHKAKNGELAAGSYAKREELLAIGSALAKAGRRVFSVVSDPLFPPTEGYDWVETNEELDWMAELSRRYNIPVTYMLLDVMFGPDAWRYVLNRGLGLNRDGAWLVAQVAGKPGATMVGWESNHHLFTHHETYKRIADLPFDERIEKLRDPEIRRAILDEPFVIGDMPDMRGADPVWRMHQQMLSGNLYQLGDPPDYEPAPDRSLIAIAERKNRPVLEVAYDMMLDRDGHELLYTPLSGYTARNFDALREMMTHPSSVLGLADAGAHVGYLCDGSMPTFMLTHWVRDRMRGERIPVEQAVHLQTERTARLFGFEDRGRLEAGYVADINVIDLEHLRLESPVMSYDLPAGGKRLTQHAHGYRATVKSGTVVREHDEATGDRPGRLLRGPQTRPQR
jgi:N-acyl-D-aspartate/D-glutamate deacylase